MLGSPKSLASLSSTLLARKGQARPAMRPQGFNGVAVNASLDDLGWNDMGQEPAAPAPAPALQPAPVVPIAPVVEAPVPEVPATMPPVLVQREALQEEFAAAPVEPAPAPLPAPAPAPVTEAEMHPVSLATAARLGRETAKQLKKGGKAAFTLRLDADRHLRLRLASALSHRSSQQLVTEALDALIAQLPQVEALASQLPPAKPAR